MPGPLKGGERHSTNGQRQLAGLPRYAEVSVVSASATPAELRASRIAAAIRQRGQRVTPQRMAVIEEFLARTDHPSVELIYRAVSERFSMMAVSTVYDTIRLLIELGEAVAVGAGGNEARYDPCASDHGHLVCTRCGHVTDLRMPEDAVVHLDPAAAAREGFCIDRTVVQAYGLCAGCKPAQ